MASRVLVTGGCGFVGRHTTSYLLALGVEDIWICDDLSTGLDPDAWLGEPSERSSARRQYRLRDAKVTCHVGDVRSFLQDSELPPFDDVIHLASIVGGRTMIEGDDA